MKFSYLILLFLPAIILFSGCHHAAPAPTPPVLNSVALSDTTDGSTSTTDDLTVSVGLSATGSPTQMMLSETSDFTGPRTPTWGDYLAAATFTFTGSAGTKTLYCKVKNSAGESNTVNQSITYAPPSPLTPPVLNSVTLSDTSDGSTATTDNLTVNVALSASGSPTQMMFSESSNFSGERTASWVTFSAATTFAFTGSAGTKTLYCKLKNSSGESNVVSKSITYAPPAPPVLNSVTLTDTTDGSTSTTDNLTVNVALSASGSPTQMMLSETSDFTGKRTPSWGDYLATATFTFTGQAGTKTLYGKLKNSSGESNVVSKSITYAPPSPPPTHPEWFTWWGGEAAHQIASANSVMYDLPTPLSEKSAGWIGIYRYEGTQNDPEHITDKLNERLGQGYNKAFFEVERALSRPEIIALNNWATAHPNFKMFLWMLSYQWIAPYGTEPTQTYFTEQNHRIYTYWDEYQNSPDNVIFCFEVYFSMNAAAIVTDFTNDTLAASEENTWIQQNYLALINTFGLKDQSLIVISLGGEKSQNPNFDLNDLTREMNLCKAELPLGIGFYGTTDGWHSPGFIEAADNFCTAWENE